MKYCSECGQCLADSCTVCPVCGHDASDASAKPENPYEAEKYVRSGIKYSYVKPKATIVLIAINVLMYLFITVLGFRGSDLVRVLSMHRGAVASGQFFRILTSVFTHRELFHLLSNCYALYIYGTILEPAVGKIKYLLIYFAGGLLGNVLTFAFMPNPSIGASGAIFGLLGAVIAIYFINPTAMNRMMMRSVISCVIITTIYSFTGGINNIAHFGGLFGGYLMTCICISERRRKRFFTSRILVTAVLIICITGSVFTGAKRAGDANERQYGNWTVMCFLASFDMYKEADMFAEKILSDEKSYYSFDAAATGAVYAIKSGDKKTAIDKIEMLPETGTWIDENIYNDFVKYVSLAAQQGIEG